MNYEEKFASAAKDLPFLSLYTIHFIRENKVNITSFFDAGKFSKLVELWFRHSR